MLLIISNKRDIHTDIVVERLRRRSIRFLRWNLEDFLQTHSISLGFGPHGWNGRLTAEGRTIDFAEVRAVWYRRPGTLIPDDSITDYADQQFAIREAQHLIRGMWHLLERALWINDPLANQRMSSKPLQLQIASEIGFAIPKTLLTNEPSEAEQFFRNVENVIAKPLSGGFVERPGKVVHIYTNRILPENLAAIQDVRLTPTLFQEYVPKKLELRVTVIGQDIFCCAIDSQKSLRTRDDWRYDFENVPHFPWTLPKEIAEALRLMTRLGGLQFAAYDLILTPTGDYVFLELNPNGQWYWIEQITGLSITERLVDLLETTLSRRTEYAPTTCPSVRGRDFPTRNGRSL